MPHPLPTMAGSVAAAAVLLLAVATAVSSASDSPKIVAEANKLTVQAGDLVLQQPGDGVEAPPISLSALHAQVQALAAREPGPTAEDVTASVDAAVAGAIRLLLDGNNSLTQGVAALKARLDAADDLLAGLPQTQKAVADIAEDVVYLLAHSVNVTYCAAGGDMHVGDGTCANPIPQCEAPAAPSGGNVSISSQFIIPGVTAEYTCSGATDFVAGPTVRTCVEATLEFDGTDPSCLTCQVVNCVRCVSDVSTCAECAYGHDLTADSRSCPERSDTIIMMEGTNVQSLGAKATSWERFYPGPPAKAGKGALALIRGTTYLVGHGGHSSNFGFYKLDKGATTWSTFPKITGTTQFNGDWIGYVSNPVFYCTINGVGTAEDGFYIFYLTGSAVYQPLVDETQWKPLPVHGNGNSRNIRSDGATAVIGSKIYLLGGNAKGADTAAGKFSAVVDLFDTSTKTFSAGVPMTAGRVGHAAASYDGKIFVFGGRSAAKVPQTLVEMFDPEAQAWSTKTPMPEAWEYMSTGPMPVFPSGTVLIPYAEKSASTGIIASLEYDTKADSWQEGPAPVLKEGKYVVVQGSLE